MVFRVRFFSIGKFFQVSHGLRADKDTLTSWDIPDIKGVAWPLFTYFTGALSANSRSSVGLFTGVLSCYNIAVVCFHTVGVLK